MKIKGIFLRCGKVTLLAVLTCLVITIALGDTGRARPVPAVTEARLRGILDCMALGRMLFHKGDYIHAAMQFEKVLEIDPSNTSAAEMLRRCEKNLEAER